MRTIIKTLTSLSLLVLFGTVNINAAFLQNVPQTITQPNGTKLHCFASGDEFYNWLHCADGYTIIQNLETGFYVFADKVGNELVPTNLIFGINNPQELNLQKNLTVPNNPVSNELRNNFNEQLKILNFEKEQHRKEQSDRFQSQRTINNIVIFVEFADASFANIDSLRNAKIAEYNTENLSMREYWKEVSYGQLTMNSHFFSFQTVRNRGYFQDRSPSNPEGYTGFGERIARQSEILTEAILAIKPGFPSDLDLDSDNDGCADAITIIFQGNAISTWGGGIFWPHALRSAGALTNETINGKRIRSYNVLMETWSNKSVAIHELGHIFGAPDFYVVGDNIIPVEHWDPMSNNLLIPPHFTMHLKQKYFRWIDEIPEITVSGTYTLSPVTSATNNAFRISSPYSDDEFFMLEYRQHIAGGFNGDFLKNHYPQNNGLLIYRVIPRVNGNLRSVQNGEPYEMYIYRQNGTVTENGFISLAAFSDEYGRTVISNSTNPTAFLSTGADGGLNISDVQLINNGEQIQFTVAVGPGKYYTLTTTVAGEGAVATNPANTTLLLSGTEITLTAVNPAPGYQFVNWTDTNNNLLSTANPYTITLTSNRTVRANFEMIAPPIVTTENDDGPGSLRRIVRDAPNGSKVIFANTVNHITLTSGQIIINKNLTIDGGNRDTNITVDANGKSRIFYVNNNFNVSINNITFTKGSTGGVNFGGAIFLDSFANLTVANCSFIENHTGQSGGAIFARNGNILRAINCDFIRNRANIAGGAVELYSGIFTAINCNFIENSTQAGNGGAVCSHGTVIVTNSTFIQNSARSSGGAINMRDSIFIATNCTFSENIARDGEGGAINSDNNYYLYHCTFDRNKSERPGGSGSGGGLSGNEIYSYNCIYTGNTPDQIQGNVIGDNLVEGVDNITRFAVFGFNQFDYDEGYITPLPFAVGASRLNNTSNIQIPVGMTKSEILAKLTTDQAGKPRPFLIDFENEYVTYGAIETSAIPPIIPNFLFTVNATTGGTVEPDGTVSRDTLEVVIIEAFPDDCYMFLRWENSFGKVISNENPLTVTVISDSTLVAIFESNCFDFTVLSEPASGGTTNPSGAIKKDTLTIVTIEAFSENCYRFLYWKNINSDFISSENPLTVAVESDTIFIAYFVQDSVKLTVQTTTGGSVSPEIIDSLVGCGNAILIKAIADDGWYFIGWNDGSDEEERITMLTVDTVFIAYFEEIQKTKFTFRASEHKQIDPRTTNYEIPIYITSAESFVDLKIEKLVVEIDKSIFYFRDIDNENFVSNDNGFITFENITVSNLIAGEETLLLTVRGDILLGNKVSGDIKIDAVVFSSQLNVELELKNGFITLDICEFGSDRFLTVFDYSPAITLKKNPVTEMLEVESKTTENGNYSLEIIDLSGKMTKVKEFTVTTNGDRIFDFEIPLDKFSSGSYIIIMNTPTVRYSAGFVIQK